MKKIIFIAVLLVGYFATAQAPAPFKDGISTKLIQSDTLTTAQRDALTPVANKSTLIFNSTAGEYQFYNPITTSWEALGGADLSNYAQLDSNNTFTGTQQNFNGKIGLNDATPTTPLTVIHDAPDQTSSQIIASFSDQDLSVGTGVSGVLFGTLSNGTNTYGGYVASQGYEPLYLGTLTNRNSLQIADNGALNFNKYGLNNITGTPAYSLAVDASGNVIEAPLSSGSDTSEWATSTGTRAGGDLVVTLGDYDASAEGTSIKIDDSNGIVDILPYNNATLRVGNIRLTGGSFFASLDIPTLTGNRNIILPDASGTIALTSDITGSGHTIQDEGVNITQKDTLNFTGAGVSVANVGDVTTVTIDGGTPLETASTVIDLSNTTGNYVYASAATTADSFTLTGVTTGGKASVLIDTTGDSDFPTVTGSTKTNSAPFEAGVEFYMIVENNGDRTEHYFVKRDIGNSFVMSDVLDMNGNSIIGQSQTATGDGTTTIDWSNGNNFDFEFDGNNEAFTFTDPPKAGNFLLKLQQDETGSRTATWPDNVKWTGDGTAPTLNTDGTDIINFYFDGTDYWATGVYTYDAPVASTDDFISTWETTSPNETITIGVRATDNYDVIVYWGDGDSETITGIGQTFSHEYATAGTYNITIEQNTPNGWKGLFLNNTGDVAKITDIVQWGTSAITNLNFRGAVNLTGGTATDAPNLTALTSMANAFRGCTSLNITNWSSWEPYSVTTFLSCFRDIQINAGHVSWITSSTTNMSEMYLNNDLFNQDFATADISNVTDLTLFNTNGDGWSATNYDATLNGWASQTPQNGVTFGKGNVTRTSASDAAYTTLTTIYSWTIQN